ncbi:peptide deformylase [Kosmotoga pacifica]|uniref:Peptide deformylase n=1 Tax=Kosmotoga pacifica TaxID=1330330 RepID=A0A0G2ZCK5_9BACT|nr:peptide deformylase [Kosmotoga pacifica]AKI97279.1 peptide deformylase [Kosmotoga pacifica]
MQVIHIGNPILRKIAEPIENFDAELSSFVEELTKTMYEEDGVGLAAPQVAVSKRLFVFDDGSGPRVMINPEILEKSIEQISMEEGCLSVPGIYADITRPAWVKIRYQDVEGQIHEELFEGYSGRIVQHEYDHLEGILFIDYLSPAKKALLRPKLNNIMKGKVSK